METGRGTIIRLTKLTESSLIVHWLTQSHGLIKTVAKGARRPKNTFSGKLDLFVEGELVWVPSRRSELHTLREVAVANFRESLRKSYRNTLTASYFTQLIEHVIELDHPVPEMTDLLDRALTFLSNNPATPQSFLHFEKEVAKLQGIGAEKSNAAEAILHNFGSLPKNREACWKLLQD